MKKFRMKLPIYITVLIALCIPIELYVAVRYIIALAITPSVNVKAITVASLLLLLTAILVVICTGILIFPYYVIKGKKLTSYMGIITITFAIKDIQSLIYFKDQGKLVMYYGKDKHQVLLLSETKFEDFTKSLREINPEIIYDNKINEND